MLPSTHAHVKETVQQLFSFIESQGNSDYLGEQVSQLQHSLQCAYLATQSERYAHDHEVVLAALLHDVGRFIPAAKDMPKMIATDGSYVGRGSHEVLGERYLRQLGFSEKVCQLVGAHVIAKRYLTATKPGYYESLSLTSKRTLQYQVGNGPVASQQTLTLYCEQGGRFTEEQVEEARKDPFLEAKLAVRMWDDLAKDPTMKVPGLASYESIAISCLTGLCCRLAWMTTGKLTLSRLQIGSYRQ